MSPTRILTIAAGLLAISVSSAMADGFRYTGSPKLGQFREQTPTPTVTASRKSALDAQAQMIEPRHEPKGGISARGP